MSVKGDWPIQEAGQSQDEMCLDEMALDSAEDAGAERENALEAGLEVQDM